MEFEELANKTIQEIVEKLEEEEEIDLDCAHNILHISREEHSCIINKHSASQEIWMASSVNGAKHFRYNSKTQKWIDSNNLELFHILNEEFALL